MMPVSPAALFLFICPKARPPQRGRPSKPKKTDFSLDWFPSVLELRNAFNRPVQQQRITLAQRDALWQDVEADIASGFLVPTPVAADEVCQKARQLSDRHTPVLRTRSLDLLPVAAALLLGAREFFSLDDRQRKAAAQAGLRVKP